MQICCGSSPRRGRKRHPLPGARPQYRPWIVCALIEGGRSTGSRRSLLLTIYISLTKLHDVGWTFSFEER